MTERVAVPRAWMRKWAFDGEKPEKIKGRWPVKFKLKEITSQQIQADDIPLYAVAPPIPGATFEDGGNQYCEMKLRAEQAERDAAALRTQLEAAQGYKSAWEKFISLQTGDVQKLCDVAIDNEKLCTMLARANARADAERKDAERYRWLREQNTVMYEKQNIIVFWDGPKELDAAIDDARLRQAAAEKTHG